MKLGPDVQTELASFGIRLIGLFIASGFFGFAFLALYKFFQRDLKAQNNFKLWLCFSLLSFALYVLLRGI